jgi:phosphoribosylaminoimidazole-succinocarboxamide synthase
MPADLVLATEIEGLRRFRSGELRDSYELDYELLLIAKDRVSALGQVFPTGVPMKGRVTSQLSAFWLDLTRNVAPSHFVSNDLEQIHRLLESWGVEVEDRLLEGRGMLVNKARPIRVACTVCGYLCGAAWEEYRTAGTVGGETASEGLSEGDRLPGPRFLPRRKDAGEDARRGPRARHWSEGAGETPDASEDRAAFTGVWRLASGVPVEPGHARRMADQSLALYAFAEAYARERGLILAETTFEFGVFQGMTILIDEVLTPDTSRYWDLRGWRPGGPQPDFAYQFLLDYLQSIRWTGETPAPDLPADVVERTRTRLVELHQRLTETELI